MPDLYYNKYVDTLSSTNGLTTNPYLDNSLLTYTNIHYNCVMTTVEYRDEQKEMEMKARWRPVIKQEVKQETQSSPSHEYTPTDHTTQQDYCSRTRNQRHDSDSSLERRCVYTITKLQLLSASLFYEVFL